MAPNAITRDIVIEAPPAVVWAIVTEAEHLAGWFSDEAQIDLRPGGSILLTWRQHGVYAGRVEAVDPPRTFAFRWQARGAEDLEAGSTLVVMTLHAEGAGTRLQVVESGFAALPWGEPERTRYGEENARGWLVELGELQAYAAALRR